ncbi:MAG TPA: type II toxin-antitoxin system RelE/ParE family toxin [Chloroflexia bacterium]
MDFKFGERKLKALYYDGKDVHKYPCEVVDAFFEVMSAIAAAKDERDLYALKGLHYEKLSGKWKDKRSARLNKQYRLLLQVEEEDSGGKYLLIEKLDDHTY